MAEKKTLSEYQAAFKQLVKDMEQDFGIPCAGVYIRVQTKVDYDDPNPFTAAALAAKRRESREVQCEIQFGDSYALKL